MCPTRACADCAGRRGGFALVVDEAVGIVHKILGGREVKLRAPRLVVDT